ncbi:MAG TPA: hypothetical protein VL460_07075 [Caulobacteraceae bacterium]|jgi:hypothetical protein|nr:hypothetical protein [Caulobacteraceae bacterium]
MSGRSATKSILAAAGPFAGLWLAWATSAAAAPAVPDWTGIWTRVGSLNFDPAIPGAQHDNPPYNPVYAARFAAILDSEAQGRPSNDKSAQCLPPGLVRMMNMVYPMEILQTAGQVTIVAEWMGQIRRIFTDGRGHPADPDPTYNGHSIGHWDGATLVVDTVALHGGGILDDHGAPLGQELHVTERFFQPDPDTLKDEITIVSEDAMTAPFTAVKTFKRARDIQMMEYVCEENNRNPVGADGVTGVILQQRR